MMMTDHMDMIGRLPKECRQAAEAMLSTNTFSTGQAILHEAADALQYLSAELASKDAEIKRREALTPSADTEADYSGEISMGVTAKLPDGQRAQRTVIVPWITIKKIMRIISARAALNGGE